MIYFIGKFYESERLMNTKVKLANYYLPIFLFILSSGSAVGNVYPNFIYPLYFFVFCFA